MRNLIIFVTLILFSCKRTNNCSPVKPNIDPVLHAKVLIVPINMGEYEYFKETMSTYAYRAEVKDYGIRYNGIERTNLIITLLKPNKSVTSKYGIIQLKGHTSDMESCFNRIRQCIVPGKTIIVSGGCESTDDMCKYAGLNIPAFTVNHIGQGPKNDYLTLHLHSLLQSNSYEETIVKLKEYAPEVMSEYTYPQ